MRVTCGSLAFDLADERLIGVQHHRSAPTVTDIAASVQNALENPLGFPPLRRALTPDDHVAIVVDEELADLPSLLKPLLEHLAQARVPAEAVTLLCAESAATHPGLKNLADFFPGVRLEIHDPHNRKKLSYLATTKPGRRVYLNRTAVDADQLVIVSRRFYDPLLGIGGAEGAIYPALSDVESQKATVTHLSMNAPDEGPWPVQDEAAEIVWLLGAPFFVQIIEDRSGKPAHILAGLADTSAEGRRLQNAQWRLEVAGLADVVVAQLNDVPERQSIAAFARGLACASRVVKPGGQIILLTGAAPQLSPAFQLLRQADTPDEALSLLKEKEPAGLSAAFQWASAAGRASLFIYSQLDHGIVEELFAAPIADANEAAKLTANGRCVYLADADKALAVCRQEEQQLHKKVKSVSHSKTSV